MAHELPPATKLAAAIALLTRPGGTAPYFRTMLSLTVARVETRSLPTLAVSAGWVLSWNPDFVARTPLATLAWALYHECWHLRSRHHERARALGLVPSGTPSPAQLRNWKLANLAQDASINEQLRAAHGKGLPAEWIYPETLQQPLNLAWEQRLALLLAEQQKEDQKKDKPGDKSDAGDKPGESGESGESEPGESGKPDESDAGDKPGESGDESGAGSAPGESGESAPGGGAGDGAGDQPGVGCGGCGSCAAGGTPEDDGAGRSEAEINRALRETAQAVLDYVAKNAGPVPGELARWAQEQLAPAKIDWRDQLAATVKHAIHSRPGAVDYSFRRPSRRQAGLGYGVGAPVVPGLHQPIPRVAVVVDTSGSMSQADLALALSEIDGLLQALQASVEFISIDASVRAVAKITNVADAAANLVGGGGTDMGPAFDHLGESRERPEVVIVLTDGHFYRATPEPDWAPRTVWVLIGKNPGNAEPWGEQIDLSEMEAA